MQCRLVVAYVVGTGNLENAALGAARDRKQSRDSIVECDRCHMMVGKGGDGPFLPEIIDPVVEKPVAARQYFCQPEDRGSSAERGKRRLRFRLQLPVYRDRRCWRLACTSGARQSKTALVDKRTTLAPAATKPRAATRERSR